MKLIEQTPDLGRCWVRYAFRPWPGSSDLWLDLFSRGLGQGPGKGTDLDEPVIVGSLDDVAYLPPVDGSQEGFRKQLAERLGSAGSPVLAQSLPGTELVSSGATEIYDVLQAVATGDLAKLDTVPSGAAVVWPLISGYTVDVGIRENGLSRLAAAGVTFVQGIAADLPPSDRRRVVRVAGEQGFERLFHGQAPSEREFAAAVHRSGMEPFLRRPLPLAPTRLVHNRRLAELLASIGELWLRLGRAESRGQVFYRDARWVDRDTHDLMVLAREGNLGVVTWLDDDSRRAIQEIAARDESTLFQELRREYLESTDSLERPP